MPTYTRPTFGGATGNSYDSTTTQVSNALIRYVEPMVEALDYKQLLMTRLIGYGKEVNNRKVEWTDERMMAESDTLGGSYTAGAGTLTVSNGSRYQQYQVIKVGVTLFWVTAISTNTLTVTAGIGGTTDASAANGAAVSIVGVAMPENIDTPPAPMALGDAYSNFCQLWDLGIQISNRENYSANYFTRTPEYEWRMRQKLTEAARQLERTLFLGVGQDASGTAASFMSGFPQYITTNTTNLANAPFSERNFLDALAPAFDDIGGEGLSDTVVVGRFGKQVIGSWADPARRLSGSDTSFNTKIDRIMSDFGDLDVVMHRYCPTTELYFINPKNYSIRPFKGYGRWHDGPLPAGGEYGKGHVAGDYTLVALGNRASAKLINFSTTATDYATMAS
jgi:hypothetical protein